MCRANPGGLPIEVFDGIRAGSLVDRSQLYKDIAGGPFNNAMENPRVAGRDPEGRSYFSFASFEDLDGNRWLLQEIKERLPGREWK
jgi:hypothetical protein